MNNFLFHSFFAALILFLAVPAPALAYFDLGTGQYLIQLVFAFVAAFWLPLAHRFKKKHSRSSTTAEELKSPGSEEPSAPVNEQTPLS